MDPISIIVGLFCCGGFTFVLLAVVGLLVWKFRQSNTAETAVSTPSPAGPEGAASAEPEQRELPSAASAALSPPPVPAPSPPVARGTGGPSTPERFPEDGPTTLVDTTAPGMRDMLRTPSVPDALSEVAPTERLVVPPRPAAAPLDPGAPPPVAVPSPAAPPPLPASHAPPPPSTRQERLDPPQSPDRQSLQPGATIIPPDDWNEDYIDDDEIDETMLMVRPPLPPKK